MPHFPIEDEKLRAKGISRRRGGNTANSLEVILQLENHDPAMMTETSGAVALHLLAVLPDEHSASAKFICESIAGVNTAGMSLFRDGYEEAASSYIIQSQESRSRTIVSINKLPEMKIQEFKQRVESFASPLAAEEMVWFHFEGRIPETTYPCAEFLRNTFPKFRISVECEKPERKDIEKVARFANVVFYSKLWAEKNGYGDARTFLEAQREVTGEGAILCCTWGSGGATILQKGAKETWADVNAWQVYVRCSHHNPILRAHKGRKNCRSRLHCGPSYTNGRPAATRLTSFYCVCRHVAAQQAIVYAVCSQ